MNIYERRRTTSKLNFVPFILDMVIAGNDNENYGFFSSFYTTRTEKWFIMITLTDLNGKDALDPDHNQRTSNLTFLRALQKEYLSTANYMEAYFRNKE